MLKRGMDELRRTMTCGSSMQAMIRTAPPQAAQVWMSMPNTRLRLCPRHRRTAFDRRRRLFSVCLRGVLSASATPRRGDPRAIAAVGRKHPVEASEVDPRLRHQGCQPGDKIQRLEDDVRRAVPVGRLELVADIAVRRERQAPFRDGRAADVATQPLKLVPLVRLCRDPGVERKACHLAGPALEGLLVGG